MRIEHITLHHLRMPLVAPFETSFGRVTERECILVQMTSEGLTGYGECVADRDPGYAYETAGTAWHILTEFLCPAIVGKDVAGPAAYRAAVAGVRGHPMAKASLEMALWDLQGKAEGRPLRELLGGVRERVDVGVSVGLQASPAALVETVGRYLEQGYRRIKIKIKPGRDVEDARSVRAAFPDVRLQVDANSAYTLETADALLPLDDLGLLLIEQPLSEDDIWDHRKLQARLRTQICLDESILTARHARQAIEMQACGVINIKAGRVGWIDGSGRSARRVPGARRSGLVRRDAGNRRWQGGEPGPGEPAQLRAARRHLGVGPLLPPGHYGRTVCAQPRQHDRRARQAGAGGDRRDGRGASLYAAELADGRTGELTGDATEITEGAEAD